MKAAFIQNFGGPAALTYGDLPDPTPGQGQVLIDVAACKGVETMKEGEAISKADIVDCAAKQKTEIRKGDVLMILLEFNGPGGFFTELGRTLVMGNTVPGELQTRLEQAYRVGDVDLITTILSQQDLAQALEVTDLFQRTQQRAADVIGE